MDRKIVKPAQNGGRIWSPEHNRFLPNEGIEVGMAPYWLHLIDRGDVVTESASGADQPTAATPQAPPVQTA